MGVSNSIEIFQQKMNDLFQGFEFILAHLYDLLVLQMDTAHIINRSWNKTEITWMEKGLNLVLKTISSEKPQWDISVSG